MRKTRLKKNLSGFSLIEVVVSFAILAGLGIALVQSQLSSTRLVSNAQVRDAAAEFIETKLQELERNPQLASANVNNEKFNSEHPLYPGSWSLVITDATLIIIPVRKVKCIVKTTKNQNEVTASASIMLSSIDADYIDVKQIQDALSGF